MLKAEQEKKNDSADVLQIEQLKTQIKDLEIILRAGID